MEEAGREENFFALPCIPLIFAPLNFHASLKKIVSRTFYASQNSLCGLTSYIKLIKLKALKVLFWGIIHQTNLLIKFIESLYFLSIAVMQLRGSP